MLDPGNLLGPGAAGVIGVGEAGGVLAFGFGQMLKQDVESLLQGGAGHKEKPITGTGGWHGGSGSSFARMPTHAMRLHEWGTRGMATVDY
jgi:hypothetical protein